MIPIEAIKSGTLTNLLYYVSIIGVLLVIGTIIRLKVPLLQKAFIPASLIAGIIGLIIGPRFIGIIPKEMMTSMSRIPSLMITVVFACMMLGNRKKELNKELIHDTVAAVIWTWSASFLQFAIPCLLCVFFFTPVFGLNPLFGAIVEVGFAGGHGTASGMAGMFKNPAGFNWPEGADLALTFATIGLLAGIFGGIALINYAVRKGYTKVLRETVSGTIRKEVFSAEESRVAGHMTISPDVVEPFAFHLGLIGGAILIGRAIVWGAAALTGYKSLPLFPFAMIGGWILNEILQHLELGKVLDKGIFQRIQGMALEILIVAAMASINTKVIADYWFPLLVTSIAVLAATIAWMFLVCPHIFKKCWFELSIMEYGVKTGVAAVGYMLLRTSDPEMKTEAGSIYALSTPFTSAFIGGGLVTSAVPYMIKGMGAANVGFMFLAGAAIALVILKIGFWDKPNKSAN